MTINDARKIAELVRRRDDLEEWLITIAKANKKMPFIEIEFAETEGYPGHDNRSSSGWQGALTLPRAAAVSMLRGAVEKASADLRALKVDA